jgi:hypothetical protein
MKHSHDRISITAAIKRLPNDLVLDTLQQRLRVRRNPTARRLLDLADQAPFACVDILINDLAIPRCNQTL